MNNPTAPRDNGGLWKRVLTALWGIPLVVVFIWFDRPLPWFSLFAAVWVIFATIEFFRLVGIARSPALMVPGVVGAVMLVLSPHFPSLSPEILTGVVAVSLLAILFSRKKEHAFQDWAWAIAGTVYVGWLFSYLVALRLEAGREWLYFPVFVTFASDAAAFFVGRSLGRHRMAPRISPRKTWEGAAAGVVGAALLALVFTLPSPLRLPLGVVPTVILGILVSVFGQAGDLAESLLKRTTGVKESGTLFPGHGGMLDRMDSIVFAGVVVYYVWRLFLG
ncbi:MAG: phosphatidate cytidylyltransferase [Chloroflexota bacterium]